ncbi:pirin family protein [Vibrio navarrensis]|uniref:Pirin family protein n=1 Tax=Vibrio navarrensis TaxID=29495 RepID=A0AAJ4IEZ1_9VIBR|nr:pirin family protein [Vibrio navarrensis]MBE3653057.1 pirin family protein [Vibrio navarrensis]MBE3655157.1 pirin family protein [Vibrio navarrensis]MBE3669161.1 pirin family protein [Vibrio navarrensis]MBE4592969.1 pirin family protein [Vibrio navarrensis]QPL55451.1 pirin family protein [Vibrio navarrensis]
MISVRQAQERGRANFGWLDSKHTFSFGSYYDPQHMGFSALRVINDDKVIPGAGFETHGHRDMEIISYVLSGTIAHKDSEGNVQTLPAGEFQLMSAGKGIYHSEFNASKADDLRFLQIWIEPNSLGGQPGYQQKDFGREPGLTPIATPDGREGTLHIKQDATLSQLILASGESFSLAVQAGRKVYVHLVSGTLSLDSTILQPGDGAKVVDQTTIELRSSGSETVTALVFDLP